MKLPKSFMHCKLTLADVETQDISKYFDESFTFIEEARAANEGASIVDGALLKTVRTLIMLAVRERM